MDRAWNRGDTDRTIFLTDDDPDDRELFCEALQATDPDIRLVLFPGGEALLDHLGSGDPLPDIVFLDLNMPKMDGAECLDRIRSDERFDAVCLIIYSTVVDLDRIGELFGAGANRYLKKPSSFSALKNALENSIGSVRDNPLGGHAVINYSE